MRPLAASGSTRTLMAAPLTPFELGFILAHSWGLVVTLRSFPLSLIGAVKQESKQLNVEEAI